MNIHRITSQKMTFSVFIFKRNINHCYFISFVFDLPCLKIFLICSYFFTNFGLVVPTKFALEEKSVKH